MDTRKLKDNFELSKDFYQQTFYQTIETLMQKYGSSINRDLCFLLRQLALSRITYQNLVMRDFMKDGNVCVCFEVELDPYQSIDLFIARPKCHQKHNSQIFTFVTSDWNLHFGDDIKPYLAKLEQANARLFIYQAQKIYRVIEGAYQTKIDHQDSFKLPEAVIEELTVDLESEDLVDRTISKLTSKELYKNHCRALIKDLNSKLPVKDQAKLTELLSTLGRLEEINTLQIVNGIKTSTNQEIKKKFGSQHNCDIDLQYKYMNYGSERSESPILGSSERSSFKTELRLFEVREES